MNSADSAADDPDLREVVDLERRLLQPEVRADPGAVGSLLHADFREFGASGREWDAASIVAALSLEPGSGGVGMSAARPVRVGPDAILLTYEAQSDAGASLRSSLWVRDDDRWRLRFHQGTRRP